MHASQPVELSAGQVNDRVSKLESSLTDVSNTLVLERAKADSETRALSSQVTSLTMQLETARAGDVSKSTLVEAVRAERDEARRMLADFQSLAQQSSTTASAEIATLKQQREQTSSELATLRSLGQQLENAHRALQAEHDQTRSTAKAGHAEILSL